MKELLITSPAGYANRLQKAFSELEDPAAFHPVSYPMIQTEIYTDSADFQTFIQSLDQYDYVAFSSRKAIEAFASYIHEHAVALPSQLQCCAIGKDNELLTESLHIQPAFVADEPSPMGIVHTLQAMEGTKGRQIAVLAPEVIGMAEPHIVPDFIAALQQIGMCPSRITAYRTSAASQETLLTVRQLITQQQVRAVVFTSGTEISVFLRTLPEDLSLAEYLKDIAVICYGPYTASCAEKLGVKVDFVSPAFGSFQQLVQQIQQYYQTK